MPKTIPAMLEPASPNIVAVAGMEAALDETIGRISDFEVKEKELTEYLVKGLEKIENVTTYLPLEDSHIGIVAFNIEGYKAEDVGTILDQDYHIAVRTGYHCAPLIHKHLMDIEKGGVIRASVGRYTTRNDIEKLLEAVEELEKDTFIQDVLGDHIAGKYIDAKRKEWHEYRSQVSEWEIQEYLYKY
jgi:selenocysteine lyase/cysteine desulfurase